MRDRIRQAVECGDFLAAASLWEEWAASLRQKPDPAEWEQMTELYRWARGVALCMRAQLQDRCNGLSAAQAYTTCP
jgi:hypothetical protein